MVRESRSKPKTKKTRETPTFLEETGLFEAGYRLPGGIDEVGRGPLAGPVVAGVAVLPRDLNGSWVGRVRDSKQMTALQREEVLPHLRAGAIGLEVGMSPAEEIDEVGIVVATRRAIRRALDRLGFDPDFLLLDAFPLPGDYTPQKAIVRGDAQCLSIAAASIVAKVARDRLMVEADAEYPGYGFARHKGYATAEHLRSLQLLGPCPIHRYSFAPVRARAQGGSALFASPRLDASRPR